MTTKQEQEDHQNVFGIWSVIRRWVFTTVAAASAVFVSPAHAAGCTAEIQEYDQYEKRSGECSIDDASNTVVIYDAAYWGHRGRKLLLPQVLDGRKAASFIAISPTDLRSNDVAHAMSYVIVVKTTKGLYRFRGETATTTYRANSPPALWWRQQPGKGVDYDHTLTTTEMLTELSALKPSGPALGLDLVARVVSQNQNLADRLPKLAGVGTTTMPGGTANDSASILAVAEPVALSETNPTVRLETSAGNITLQLDARKAPKTVANFLVYVKDGYYDGTVFHRVIKNFMVQGGGYDQNNYSEKQTRAPIENEGGNGLKNLRGTVAMARTNDPQSATAQFFINHADNDFLNAGTSGPWGYAVFGRVVEGMAVVDQIASTPTGSVPPFRQDAPETKIIIKKATVVPTFALADLGDWAPVSPRQQATELRTKAAARRQQALEEANRSGRPVASPALDELIRRMQRGGR